jgi:uncharacterized protein YndB with AHSA1/START domain
MATERSTASLSLARIFPASPESVFQAWTRPEQLKHWIAPGDLTVELAEVDLRPGGRYRIHMREPEGTEYRLVGTYQEIQVAHRLVFTWVWESDPTPIETRVTVQFRDLGREGTEVVVLHEFFPTDAMCDQHVRGWNACLAKLPPLLPASPKGIPDMFKLSVVLVLSLATVSAAVAQSDRVTRPEAYLMERDAEIALARSAAPAAVTDSATVWVLEAGGFVTAVKGSNGFVCYVARSMAGNPRRGDGSLSQGFLEPTIRAPHCMSEAAARSVGEWHALMTRLALSGQTQAAVDSAVRAALASGALAPPRSFAIAYMWSPHQHLGSKVGAWKPHMMIYAPFLSQATVGENELLGDGPQVIDGGTPWAVMVVPVRQFAAAGQTK